MVVGTEGFGVYATWLAVMRCCAAVASRGCESGLVRMCTEHGAVSPLAILRWTLWSTLPLAIVLGAALAGVLSISSYDHLTAAIVLLGALPLCTAVMAMQGYLTARGHAAQGVMPMVLGQPLGIASGVACMATGVLPATITAAAVVGLMSWACAALVGIALVLKAGAASGETRLQPADKTRCAAVLRSFTLATIGNQILARADVALAGLIASPAATGIYAVAARLSSVMVVGMQAAASALRLHLGSRHAAGTMDSLRPVLRRVRLIGFGWAGCIVLGGTGVFWLGPHLTDRFDMPGATGWWCWGILACTQLVVIAVGPLTEAMNQAGMAGRVARITLIAASGALAMQAGGALMGIVGVAIATMVVRVVMRMVLLRSASDDAQITSLFSWRA